MSIDADTNYIDIESLCSACLIVAIRKTWDEESNNVDIDSICTLGNYYRGLLAQVFSTLEIEYPPNIAGLMIFRYLRGYLDIRE